MKVDFRGLACPEPIVQTKKLFNNPQINSVEALVDDEVCVANLERLAKSLKANFTWTKQGKDFCVTIYRQGASIQSKELQEEFSSTAPLVSNKTIVFLTKDTFGQGDTEFSKTLLHVFLQTLFESQHNIQAILMANSAVQLLGPHSQSLKVLNDFKNQGIEVLACGLCLEFYGLKDKIPAEQITNMLTICQYLNTADKIISP